MALGNADTKICFSSFVYILVYELRYKRSQEGPLTTIRPRHYYGAPLLQEDIIATTESPAARY